MKYPRKAINRVGETLISDTTTAEEREIALQTLNDWRALHLYPLNTFQSTLRKYAKEIAGERGIVAQRLKRVPTILDKLQNREQDMQLGRMQDIGGLRAIVPTMEDLHAVLRKYRLSKTKHIPKRQYDYIAQPKASGYRGIHLVYECRYGRPALAAYDGLLIEIQLRTRLQHLWATAVETVGFFVEESLKSSRGEQVWLDFFKLVSALFAQQERELPQEEFQTLTQKDLASQLSRFNREHNILSRLSTIREMKKLVKRLPHTAFWVMEASLNGESTVTVYPFLKSQEDSADLTYRQLEQSPDCKSGKKQVVLVSVDSVSKLEKAYPNFFGNISEFIKEVEKYIK